MTKTSSHPQILIVEDEQLLAHALALKMEHDGFTTSVALNGRDGKREAIDPGYQVILMDLMLPEADGFSILETMKEKGVKTPVIVLTNLGQDKDRERAKQLGAREYLVKADTPIADILTAVKKML